MKNLFFVNLTSGSSSEEHFLGAHISTPGFSERGYFNCPDRVMGDIKPVLEETPGGGVRRVLRVSEGAKAEPLNPALETFLIIVSNRTRWLSKARRPVEQLGRPGGEYGCIALLTAGVEPQVLPYKEARKLRKTHWWVGGAYGQAVVLPHGVKLPRIPWQRDDAHAKECRAFAEALGVSPLVNVVRCTQDELLQHTEYVNGGGGIVIERASNGVPDENDNYRVGGSSIGWDKRLPPETRWVLGKQARLNHPNLGGWRIEYALAALADVTPAEVAAS